MSDGATVDKARFDGLMGSYQRALSMLTPEQRESIRQGQGQADSGAASQADDGGTSDGSQETDSGYEQGGHYVFDGQGFTPFEPPTPGRFNGVSRSLGRPNTDDNLRADLDRAVGKPSRVTREWDLGV